MIPEETISPAKELLNRYQQLLLTAKPTPYFKNREAWESGIKTKIKEIKQKEKISIGR